jgi:hypothetical protein
MLVGYLAALAIGADDDARHGPAVLVTQRVRRAVPALPRRSAPTFTLARPQQIKKLALSRPHDPPLHRPTGRIR